jgi:hypothetical protein
MNAPLIYTSDASLFGAPLLFRYYTYMFSTEHIGLPTLVSDAPYNGAQLVYQILVAHYIVVRHL